MPGIKTNMSQAGKGPTAQGISCALSRISCGRMVTVLVVQWTPDAAITSGLVGSCALFRHAHAPKIHKVPLQGSCTFLAADGN